MSKGSRARLKPRAAAAAAAHARRRKAGLLSAKRKAHSLVKASAKAASDAPPSGGRRRASARGQIARRTEAVSGETSAARTKIDPRTSAARQRPRSPAQGNKSVRSARAKRRAFRLEPLEARRRRALEILAGLRALYPEASCELDHRNALELLVATILSAQCTDRRVNMTTPALFARYRTAADYAAAIPAEVEGLIKPTGFYRNKTKSILALGKALAERHAGEVPETMEDLVTLPGVGRKTANVIIAEWFKRPGIAVDTHVIRLTGPIWRLTDETDPVKIEFALYELIPEEDRAFFGIATIHHGRRLCTARLTKCAECPLTSFCPSAYLYSSTTPPQNAGSAR